MGRICREADGTGPRSRENRRQRGLRDRVSVGREPPQCTRRARANPGGFVARRIPALPLDSGLERAGQVEGEGRLDGVVRGPQELHEDQALVLPRLGAGEPRADPDLA